MARRDWDKLRRKDVAAHQGAEPSEFPDLTEQIATAKGLSKPRVPWQRVCAFCGEHFREADYQAHIQSCRPPKATTAKCRYCGAEVDASRLASHVSRNHPKSWWPNLPPKGITVQCKFCGKTVTRRGLNDHQRVCPHRYQQQERTRSTSCDAQPRHAFKLPDTPQQWRQCELCKVFVQLAAWASHKCKYSRNPPESRG